MNTYLEDMSERVWDKLRDGGECFVSDNMLGPVGAEAVASRINCHCAYRYRDAPYEFSISPLVAESKLDLLLIGKSWRHGQ